MTPACAVILGAGLGLRLRGAWDRGPKGLLAIGPEALADRSRRLLRERGVRRIVVVTGHRAEAWRAWALDKPDVALVHNPDYADTGSLASLACALPGIEEPFLLLESDVLFEARALDALSECADADADAVLASGPTGAGDEVWIEAPGGYVRALSKDPAALASRDGELVGVCRVSPPLARELARAHEALRAQGGHGRWSYDTDGLPLAARARAPRLVRVDDLCWAEIDDEAHLRRAREVVWPRLRAIERA
ncbi:MAG: phosphocholine cytidylyltransferase family protein [Vicinamibacteria bacterium]|nr:phosphocholine cytidylyltransferase family protein [Vicinamibacteria bacterium]